MIYRELKLKGFTFEKGDIAKECILEDCINLDLIHMEKCEVITKKKSKKKKCEPCEKKKAKKVEEDAKQSI